MYYQRKTNCEKRGRSLHKIIQQLQNLLRLSLHQFQDQEPGNHAGVAAGKIAEIVVGAHFTAIEGIEFAHSVFDEGMPGFRDMDPVIRAFFMVWLPFEKILVLLLLD